VPLIKYKDHKFTAKSEAIISMANIILNEYAEQGFDLTLRQLYYQFVARGYIPNTQREYKKLGSIVNDARLAGLIDWDHISDRTRNLQKQAHWSTPDEIIGDAVNSYRIDKWKDQIFRLEVWIEKDALVGVIESVCNKWQVPYFSCRGYTSQSEMWNAAMRIDDHSIEYINGISENRNFIILHLGDHDPSGIDMTRDIDDRLYMFEAEVTVKRIALNMDQIDEYKPPPNPAKITDSRVNEYINRYGGDSWELDALEPAGIESLIEQHINNYLDMEKWKEAMNKEKSEKEYLRKLIGKS